MISVLDVIAQDAEVDINDHILGRETVRNNLLTPGLQALVLFLWGKEDQLHYTTHEGIDYFIGSCLAFTAQEAGSEVAYVVPTRALWEGTWDALATVGIATGSIRTLRSEGRIVGMGMDDINAYYRAFDQKWFRGVLKVNRPWWWF